MYVKFSADGKPRPKTMYGYIRKYVRWLYLNLVSFFVKIDKMENKLQFIYCHYVFDDQIDHFEKQMSYLKNIGEFVDTKTALSMLKGDMKIDRRYFHLSFDDGFKNIALNAAPVLKKLGIPALCFIPSSLIGCDYEVAKKFCLEVTRYPGVIELMGWNDVRRLASVNIEIASHTKTHAHLSAIDDCGLLENEIIESKFEIENNIDSECLYFSWPYGGPLDISPDGLVMASNCYDAVFGAFRGNYFPGQGEHDINYIARHHFEADWPIPHLKYFLCK